MCSGAQEQAFVNSVGMKMVPIQPGSFSMGQVDGGDFDEKPVHRVNITKGFYMAATEVTNAQYEQFDGSHRAVRGKYGISSEDDEAVVFVSWYNAVEYCQWLSEKEGKTYRLPTEAEWEYACRAGTSTVYNTGDELPEIYHNNQKLEWYPEEVNIPVGKTPANQWGLYDMHGNVEEWCMDWYGPYIGGWQSDPVGYDDGDFRVTRGGSHSTKIYYLRSANRIGALPEDKTWLTGFRVVMAETPSTKPFAKPALTAQLASVRQDIPKNVLKGPNPKKPYFRGPLQYVKVPEGSKGPLFSKHNHDAAITKCANGDLFAIWYSTIGEAERHLTVAASRLRYGAKQWEPAYLFWDVPDRNDHAPSMWTDDTGRLYHFNGLAVTGGWKTLVVIMRTSDDHGATWSKARIVLPEYGFAHQPVESTFETSRGDLILGSDDRGGTQLWLSPDRGLTWRKSEGKIRGIHAGIVELSDGRIMAFGRGKDMDGKMPISISSDDGDTWQFSPSEFQPLGGGQRITFIKLKSGALFLASFCRDMPVVDASGKTNMVKGLFGALSVDDGKTWRYKRLITDDKPARDFSTMDGHYFMMGPHTGEPVAYLAACQSGDGLIHLVSSFWHYTFNEQWLKTAPPASKPAPVPVAKELPAKKDFHYLYDPTTPPSEAGWGWNFKGDDIIEAAAVSFPKAGIMKISTGVEQQVWWRSEEPETIGLCDYKKGYTTEIRAQVLRSASKERGVDLEIYDGEGSRYVMTVKENGVYWYEGIKTGSGFIKFSQYVPLIEGIDNTDSMHTYRMAIRPDRVAQIYRDDKLIGVKKAEYRTPRGPYIYFGLGEEAEALIDYVGYELSGAYRPGK
jgi:formylglycine-generating enzyme required for sulfatase activity